MLIHRLSQSILWLLFSITLLFTANAYGKKPIVVYDIDWTLVNPIEEQGQRPDFVYGDAKIRIMPLVPESLFRLIRAGYDVAFFSGGEASRNTTIVKQIFLRIKEIAKRQNLNPEDFQPLVILSKNNMQPDPTGNVDERFRFRFDKNLLIPYPPNGAPVLFDENLVMAVDDISDFAVKSQEHLFLILQPTFNNYDDFSAVPQGVVGEFIPPSYVDWYSDRHRISWSVEVLIRAKQASEKAKSPLWQEVQKLVVIDPDRTQKLSLFRYQESRKAPRQQLFMIEGILAARALLPSESCNSHLKKLKIRSTKL